jgi:hypothetical protein
MDAPVGEAGEPERKDKQMTYDVRGNEACGICGHALNAHSAWIAKGYMEAGDCRDPDIPVPTVIIEDEPLRAFNEANGIAHNDAVVIGPYVVEIDAETGEVSIHGANELVRLSPQEACLLYNFLSARCNALLKEAR